MYCVFGTRFRGVTDTNLSATHYWTPVLEKEKNQNHDRIPVLTRGLFLNMHLAACVCFLFVVSSSPFLAVSFVISAPRNSRETADARRRAVRIGGGAGGEAGGEEPRHRLEHRRDLHDGLPEVSALSSITCSVSRSVLVI